MQFVMDDRKEKILMAVIRNYLETGEPVGSRTLSKGSGLNLSSATIRNEMADLEEMGYLLQPHTSAGRIPSDKGYRFYVDQMMAEKERGIGEREKAVEEKLELLLKKEDKLDNMLQKVAKVLASDTNYATMVSAPSVIGNKIKFLQVSKLDKEHLVLVAVIEGNLVRNRIIPAPAGITEEILLALNLLLNTKLTGVPVEEITLGLISELKMEAGPHGALIGEILDLVIETIRPDEDLRIFTSGATNILKYPELSDHEKISEVLGAFEEKQELSELAKQSLEGETETGIQVYIGEEAPVATMRNCSVVTATYELGGGMRGTVGIIGPKRMDYGRVIRTLKTLKRHLDEMYQPD
ncbi:MAG: heat-inducible transcription repressor HrcA [Lachnospiraceae bacterium]|nr:heat-inducible transcription repressor HrcA [Lachnospiraceae bacterium]